MKQPWEIFTAEDFARLLMPGDDPSLIADRANLKLREVYTDGLGVFGYRSTKIEKGEVVHSSNQMFFQRDNVFLKGVKPVCRGRVCFITNVEG